MTTEGTSLIEELNKPGFHASLVSTYTCFFPFYEEVVLRKLITAGCTHNILFVDAARCAEAFSSEELRPRRAGIDYTLIPVRTAGAFHPKVFLRLGKSKGSLFIGSHNVTLSGFGLNDELTNQFHVEGAGARATAAPFRHAFDYLMEFVPTRLPDVVDACIAAKRGATWLDGPVGTGDSDRTILTTSGVGPDLWSRIVPLIPTNVATAFLSGPFFDSELSFVRRVQRDVGPLHLLIGIDPSSVGLDTGKVGRLSGVRWINIAGLAPSTKRRKDSTPYLHAKLLWFESKKQSLLVSGSANPSAPAFLASAGARNAEAIVADRRATAGAEIGIEALLDGPEVTKADWTVVADRAAEHVRETSRQVRLIFLATPSTEGFTTTETLPDGLVFCGVDAAGSVVGEARVRRGAGTEIDADDDVRDGCRHLESKSAKEELFVVIHRKEAISRNLGSDTRKALRRALGALEEDPSQLETLLKLTEKVIFDSDEVVRAPTLRVTSESKASKGFGNAPLTLALEALGKRSSRRRQSLANGDIVVLLDALVRRLGEGLPLAPSPERTDQGDREIDEEEGGELARTSPDYEFLAKACQGKSRRLITRMIAQLQKAKTDGNARRGIVQLSAVLGVLLALRTVSQRKEWRRKQLELTDRKHEWLLFEAATVAIGWGDDALLPRALVESEGEWFEELSIVLGLLAWLAWDIQIDVIAPRTSSDDSKSQVNYWYRLQLLALLSQWFVGDVQAASLLANGAKHTPRFGEDSDRWIRVHSRLAGSYSQACSAVGSLGQKDRSPQVGELVALEHGSLPRVRVILGVRPSTKSLAVEFFDPTRDKKRQQYLASHVATLPWSLPEARSEASA